MRNKGSSTGLVFHLLLGCFILILPYPHAAFGAQSTPSLTYAVIVQPDQRGQVEIAVQGYTQSSLTFRMLSQDVSLNAFGNIGDVAARDPQGRSLPVTTLSDGWTVSNPGSGDFTFAYSFGTSISQGGGYSAYYCYVSANGAFFLNEIVFVYPDQPPGSIEVIFQKPGTWTVGTTLTPVGSDRYSVPAAPDLKSGLLNDSTRMGVAEAVVTQDCGGMSITFIAYQPTWSYEAFWYPAYGNSQVQQMQEYVDLNCSSINYLKNVFGFWPGADRYWISTFATGRMERPTNYDHWMQAWPRERQAQVPHHTLHAWIYAGTSQASLLFTAMERSWFHEGIPSYYESKLTAALTGNTMWLGGLYPGYLITKRAAKFGLLEKSSVRNYALGCMQALALDKKIAEVTGGRKSLDDLLTVLGQRYGPDKRRFGQAEMLSALTEATGADLTDFYQRYLSGWVSSELPPVDGYISDYLGYFTQWLDYQLTSQTHMKLARGFRTLFLIDLELGLHAPIGYGTDEHGPATGSGLSNTDRFRNAIGDSGSVTKEKVIATLSSLTGADQSDFFEFYSALGVTPSVGDIKAWLDNETACTPLTLTPATDGFAPQGGSGAVSFSPPTGGCFWTAASNAPWITVTSESSDNGSATVSYSVAENRGAARTGTLSIGYQTLTITQSSAVVLPGDINNDGSVTPADAILACQVLTDAVPTAQPVWTGADVSMDGKIGFPEAIYILQKAAGVRQ